MTSQGVRGTSGRGSSQGSRRASSKHITDGARPSLMVLSAALVGIAAGAAQAQRPPLVGTVSPQAVAPPVQQPAPIGGLRTAPVPTGGAPGRGLRPAPFGSVWLPYAVSDAPLARGGVVLYDGQGARPSLPRWLPTYEKPRWQRDTTAAPSDMWRDLIVHDVVCDLAGTCLPRSQRVRARWIARCDCYAFADGLGRIWWVEDRKPARRR